MSIEFTPSKPSTLGIEWEIALVDRDTGDLRPEAPRILDELEKQDRITHPDGAPRLTRELLQNTVECVTGVHNKVADAVADLASTARDVSDILDPLNTSLYCAGSHPFAEPTLQEVSDKDRYATLIDRTQWWGRQMVIYGVHVHVGIDHRDKALPIVDGLINKQPHLLALTSSSPFWGGTDTGYGSQRSLMFQQLPTAGLPFHFSKWFEYESYVADMLHTGVVDVLDEIRWDARPVPKYGTVEMRICDGLPDLDDIAAVAAYTQCLVTEMSDMLDAGWSIPVMTPWFRVENKWRAARYGREAIIIVNSAGDELLVTDHIAQDVERLTSIAERLGCAEELNHITTMMQQPCEYERQRNVAEANGGDLASVVKDNSERLHASLDR